MTDANEFQTEEPAGGSPAAPTPVTPTPLAKPTAGGPEKVVYVQMPVQKSPFKTFTRVLFSLSLMLNVYLIAWFLIAAAGASDVTYVSGNQYGKYKVVIIPISGMISDQGGGAFTSGGVYSSVMSQLKKAREDESVIGVVLEVNSPGGTVTASDVILNEVVKLQNAKKEVIVWMGEVAARGG